MRDVVVGDAVDLVIVGRAFHLQVGLDVVGGAVEPEQSVAHRAKPKMAAVVALDVEYADAGTLRQVVSMVGHGLQIYPSAAFFVGSYPEVSFLVFTKSKDGGGEFLLEMMHHLKVFVQHV